MKLFEIAFACYIYSRTSDYDSAYQQFLASTNHALDIRLSEHRIALLKWLNKWGCRQFAKIYHQSASKEIKNWYEECNVLLFPQGKSLLELSDADIDAISQAYAKLAERIASKRYTKNGNESDVTIGPTGAGKILFALRPEALPPWDDPIRKKLELDGTAKSYADYLEFVKQEIEELGEACKRNNYTLSDLPKLIDRPNSSLVKLVDEYFWVTLTKRCPSPTNDNLVRWTSWH